ncbi:MAG: metalloregulator ArsR/SmtB family transcription factor [Marmoricola sp.]
MSSIEGIDVNEAMAAEIRELHERVCKAIADPKRLMIIVTLRDGELSVGEIADSLGLTQSNASQHLAILRDRGVVETRRAGTTVYYSLRSYKILQAIDLMRAFLAEQTPLAPASTAPRMTSIFLG